MKGTLNIGIDADGIIFDLFNFQIEKGKKFFKKSDNEIDVKKYDITGIFNCSWLKRQIFWIRYIYEYCMHSPIVDNAVETIKQWKEEGHKVYNITSRVFVDQRTPLGALFRYLLKKRYKKEGIEFDGIDYCSEKNSARDKMLACHKRQIDFMMEDKADNVEEISKITRVICFDWPYNRDCNVKNMVRVSSKTGFEEADKIIKNFERLVNEKVGNAQYVIDGKFKRLRAKEEEKLSNLELIEYYKQRKQYYIDSLKTKEEVERQERVYKFAYHIVIPSFRAYYNPQVFNKDLIPYQDGLIFVSNHLDYKDQFALLPLLGNRPIHFLAATELLKMKRGKLYKEVGSVFVDRKSLRSKLESFEELAVLLSNNKNIFIFPEGTRNRNLDKYMLPLQTGPILLAQMTGAPIVPIAVNNHYSFRSKTLIATAGEPMIVKPGDNIEEVNQILTDKLATMVWENMERVREIENGVSAKRLRRIEKMKKMKEAIEETKKIETIKKEDKEKSSDFEKALSLYR